jgi:hypothetical protein
MARYTTTVDNNNISLTIDKQEHTLSLSRTGGQGSKGDSVTNAVLNGDQDLIITITSADGATSDVNVGNLTPTISLGELSDLDITNAQEGDALIFDSVDSKFKNHALTTSKVLDIDNTGKAEGAVLVYDATAAKYQATTRIEKQETIIIGGSF